MSINASGKNLMLDALGAQCPYASLHSASPASTANELTGVYARKAITWASASAGSKALNGTLPSFDVPAGVTVSCVGFCVSGTKGTNDIHADCDVTDETYAAQGLYNVQAGTVSLT